MSPVLVVLPVLVPLFAGVILLLASERVVWLQRGVNLASCVALLVIALALVARAAGDAVGVHALGDWHAPFGIVLVADRMSALMLLLVAVLALVVTFTMHRGADYDGRHFHSLFQFQLLGLNGAFLTGDLFNLFVFFEILLIASYALLVFGGGRRRLAAGIHYVVLNLTGSLVFLIAVGVLYGLAGTLNMADLSLQLAGLSAEDRPLANAALLLLLLVFALKAAVLPVGFWLPAAYAAAPAPVAALFAVLTKVGVYAILRVHGLMMPEDPGAGARILWWAALLTLVLGLAGALAASRLRAMLAWLVLVSTGTLLAGIALATEEALAASLYYLVHSTWVTAALFLVAGAILARRGRWSDDARTGPRLQAPVLAVLFFAGAVALAGLPPLSGFVGKLLLLQAAEGAGMLFFWALLLVSGLVSLVVFARSGSAFFWRGETRHPPVETAAPLWPAALLLAVALVPVVAAEPVMNYMDATAQQLRAPSEYIETVLQTYLHEQGEEAAP